MAFSDDGADRRWLPGDKVVWLDYHNAEIKKRDERIAALEQQLREATEFLEDALVLANDTTNYKWLTVVQDWLAKYRAGV